MRKTRIYGEGAWWRLPDGGFEWRDRDHFDLRVLVTGDEYTDRHNREGTQNLAGSRPTDQKPDEKPLVCAYCGHAMQEWATRDPAPFLDDEEGWAYMISAVGHAPDCEWVATRAHRLNPDSTLLERGYGQTITSICGP